jgi:cell division protein FtsL
MSVPARRLQDPAAGRTEPATIPSPQRSASGVRKPAARPTTSSPPQRRARRGSHPAFWLFSAVLTASLLMSVVALNAMVVDATYRLQAVEETERSLVEEASLLEIDVASLSAPARIADWAADHAMVLPDPQIVVALRVPGLGGREG